MIRRASFMVLGLFVLSCTVLTVAAGTKSIGSKFNGFSLKDTNGNIHRYQHLKGTKGTAIIFLSKRCPVVGRYNARINSIARSYRARGINVIGIYSSSADSKSANYKTLIDERGVLTRQLDARYTPEIYLFNETDILVYRGLIDDDFAGRGAQNQYLISALNSVLSNKGIAKSQTQAFGCSIRRVANSRTTKYIPARKSNAKRKSRYVSRQITVGPVTGRDARSATKNPAGKVSKFSRTGNPKPYKKTVALAKTTAAPNQIGATPRAEKKRTRVSGFVNRKRQTQDDENIAQQLANPISPLLRIPVQLDYNDRVGVREQSVWQVNVEPIIPIKLGDSVNLISRTKVPTVRERDVPLQGSDRVAGLGDIEQTFFFTPSKTETGGLSWGVGPVFLLNTSTDGRLGRRKWGVGPAGALVLQNDSLTVGILANHIESFAGDDDRLDISETFSNPFISKVFGGRTTVTLNSESIYDWEAKDWTVPVNLTLSQLLKLGNQRIQVGGGPRYWATSPIGGPRGWGFRFEGTLVFPR